MPQKRNPSSPKGLTTEIEQAIRDARAKSRDEAVEQVVDVSLKYDAESHRSDNAHLARMSKCKDDIEQAIRLAWETMNPGPITEDDVKWFQRL